MASKKQKRRRRRRNLLIATGVVGTGVVGTRLAIARKKKKLKNADIADIAIAQQSLPSRATGNSYYKPGGYMNQLNKTPGRKSQYTQQYPGNYRYRKS